MRKFFSFGFSKMPLSERSSPSLSAHADEVGRVGVEDYLAAASDMDAVWYYERRRWRA
jgi:hypothetical protein